MSLLTYSPEAVGFYLLGLKLEGYVDNTFIKITSPDNLFTPKKALNGKINLIKSTNKIHNVSVILQQTSASNALLSALFNIYKNTSFPLALPILIRDRSGFSNFFCMTCYFEKEPDTTYSNNIEGVEWKFICYDGTNEISGNDLNSKITQIINVLETAMTVSNVLGIDLAGLASKLGGIVGDLV